MKKIANTQYFCRGKVNWKATYILMIGISLLWAVILFIPRSGSNEKNVYFYLLLACGLGLDLLIFYSASLRQWSKTWIKDGFVFSDLAFGLFPLSKKMMLSEVKEVCYLYTGVISRKKTDYPNSAKIRELKKQMEDKIAVGFASGNPEGTLLFENDKYRLPVHCGNLLLKGDNGVTLTVALDVVLNIASFKEIKKFVYFLPKNTTRTWRLKKITVHTSGSSY